MATITWPCLPATSLLVLSQQADAGRKKQLTSHVVLQRQVPILVSPSCWASGRTSASRAPCSQRMTHPGRPQQQSFGSSGLCLACWGTEGEKKGTTYGFESSSLLNYSTFTHSEGAASPPYTSSMHTIPSPDFSMWVMVTVAARPDATARPAGGQPRSERETLQTHCQTHFSTASPPPPPCPNLLYFAPSRAATAFSRQFLVGFPLRLYSNPWKMINN